MNKTIKRAFATAPAALALIASAILAAAGCEVKEGNAPAAANDPAAAITGTGAAHRATEADHGAAGTASAGHGGGAATGPDTGAAPHQESPTNGTGQNAGQMTNQAPAATTGQDGAPSHSTGPQTAAPANSSSGATGTTTTAPGGGTAGGAHP